jgi:hypothetical protein
LIYKKFVSTDEKLGLVNTPISSKSLAIAKNIGLLTLLYTVALATRGVFVRIMLFFH